MTKEQGKICPHALINTESIEPIKQRKKNIEFELKVIPDKETLKRKSLISDIKYADIALELISKHIKEKTNE
jgi:hypothetical protein